MRNISATAVLCIASFFRVSAQDFPTLKFESISVGWKIIGNISSGQSLDSLNQLQQISKSSLPSPMDLSTYYRGGYLIKFQNGSNIIFESPHGPVNTQDIITPSRFDVYASFFLLNHKTKEYRKHAKLSLGLFYQPFYYHQLQYARTDTVTSDSLIMNYVYYDEWSPMLGMQGAYLFHTNADKWICAYAGIGIAFGASVHPQIVETYGAMADKIVVDSVGSSSFPNHTLAILSNQQNTFKGKPSLLIEGKIPFGINFKIFKPIDLFLQGEVIASKQIYLQNSPSFSPKISASLGAGLKCEF